jgi:hypothetical protein
VIKFNHDSDLPYIGTFRLFLIIAVFSFVVYLIPVYSAHLLKIISPAAIPATSQFNLALSGLIILLRLKPVFLQFLQVSSVRNQGLMIFLTCLSV